ncbi:PIN domain-containing protein [archaeon]|jgi:predicted nucleic acid-binding protein|nr:PIN domain-containing protein [archaeon]MBT4350948.1 PIN domain-containing protein [archaeon]MBT4647635.1 PIN domain-containing protein [archaeon]MBT6822611.1 PIN domain-containing protein [archaeon]MBT7392796.1 PIN domain-containing protein [archaeon]
MQKKYFIDTSIWIDLREDRKGFNSEPLGDYALKLFIKIMVEKNIIVISDHIQRELESNYGIPEIRGFFLPFKNFLEKIYVKDEQREEAKIIGKQKKVPKGDTLHAIIARDYNLTLITRDKHFKELDVISKHYKPENII